MVEKRMETMKRTVKKGGAAVVIAAMAPVHHGSAGVGGWRTYN